MSSGIIKLTKEQFEYASSTTGKRGAPMKYSWLLELEPGEGKAIDDTMDLASIRSSCYFQQMRYGKEFKVSKKLGMIVRIK